MSREIDVEIAEKVFDMVLRKPYEDDDRLAYMRKNKDGDYVRFCWEGNQPRYSTDIAAAWTVVEKMKDSVVTPDLFAITYDSDVKLWTAGIQEFFSYEGHYFGKYYAKEKTAPLAICKAALKAVDKSGER